jgi:hypothetical protein
MITINKITKITINNLVLVFKNDGKESRLITTYYASEVIL